METLKTKLSVAYLKATTMPAKLGYLIALIDLVLIIGYIKLF